MSTRKRLTAMIPAHNDAYTLWFCLEAAAPWFDLIFVCDDASIDETPDVIADARARHKHIKAVRFDEPMGRIDVRDCMCQDVEMDWLFWIDADDVLMPGAGPRLREIAERGATTNLGLVELWGDWFHTTQRVRAYDRCHLFVDRGKHHGFHWRMERSGWDKPAGVGPTRGSGQPLFWHLKGVKPDWRLVERSACTRWQKAGCPGRCDEYAKLAKRAPRDLHAIALNKLLHSRQDHIRRLPVSVAERIDELRACPWETGIRRFEMVYRNGRPVDRLDHEPHPTGMEAAS